MQSKDESTMSRRELPGWCALCRSRCGQIAVVENDVLTSVKPDPRHPTGEALCIKGRAAPEIVANPQRVLHPVMRTRPKNDADPGWQRIGWNEALDRIAENLRHVAASHGPEAVAFAVTSTSSSAISDGTKFIERFINRFGSPNNVYATEICNWHKDFAHAFTFGRGIAAPDFANTGCVVLWGHNPSATWLDHATGVAAARARGAKIIVVDPRQAGAAARADLWLRVRPGSDGALALGIANVMLNEGWYDRDFVRDWTNAPLLVRDDTGRFLRASDIGLSTGSELVAWGGANGEPVLYDPARRAYSGETSTLILAAQPAPDGIPCRTAFSHYTQMCAGYTPARVAEICWIDPEQVRRAAELMSRNGPVCLYGWSGIGQHTNATQTDRAIATLYALTGWFDAPGGNVGLAKHPTPDISGREFMTREAWSKALGASERPLGPPRNGWIRSDDFYRAVLDRRPYPILALVSFGANIAVSHANSEMGRRALEALPFYVHIDVVPNATSRFADILLPSSTPWEREALRIGFDTTQAAEEQIQLRPAAISLRGEARSDTWIVFELAKRLGFSDDFWHGDIDSAYRHMLSQIPVTLEQLRNHSQGIRLPLQTVHRKYARIVQGGFEGFATPTGRVELYSERLHDHGYPPLPEYVEPPLGPRGASDVSDVYPLVLTTAKQPHFCHSQQRDIPSLRRRMPDPTIIMHPETGMDRGISEGEWVRVRSPKAAIQMRAAFDAALHPRVVIGQYGWWQHNERLGMPGYDPFSTDGSNYNLLIGDDLLDPISGSAPHRSYQCEIERLKSADTVKSVAVRSKNFV